MAKLSLFFVAGSGFFSGLSYGQNDTFGFYINLIAMVINLFLVLASLQEKV